MTLSDCLDCVIIRPKSLVLMFTDALQPQGFDTVPWGLLVLWSDKLETGIYQAPLTFFLFINIANL